LGDLGRKPTEYEVVTHKLNHTMREPPLELSPDAHGNVWLKRHRDGMQLSVPDWDAFRDPEQLTYRKYVKNQDDNETYIDGVLREFTEVHRPSHPPTVADFLPDLLNAGPLSRPRPSDDVRISSTAGAVELHRQLCSIPNRRSAASDPARCVPHEATRSYVSGAIVR
jgi:hypothetical protein